MGGNDAGKKRPRSYYKKCMHKKRKRWHSVEVGMQGFLVTCNKNESQAVKEMYNLFNEYADKLYGPEQNFGIKKKIQDGSQENSESSSSSSSEEDIEKVLDKELSALKEMVPSERRFQQVDTGAKNCLFIKTTVSNPCELIHAILKDVYETQIQKCRFALRVLPIQTICRANVADICKMAEDLFEPFFRTSFGTMLTYGISFKARMTNKVSRDEVIDSLCRIISEMNPLNKVNYNNPDLIVIVEVLRGLCCLSVVKDFNKFRKYNLQEVARAQQSEIQRSRNGSANDGPSTATKITDTVSQVTESNSPKTEADISPKIAADSPSKIATESLSKSAAESPSKSAAETSKVAVESPSKSAAGTSKIAAESTSKRAVETSKVAAESPSKIAAESPSKSAVETSKVAATTTSEIAVDSTSKSAVDTSSKDKVHSTSTCETESSMINTNKTTI